MEKVLASIITIGDELLIGQTIDTNSAWMAQQLNEAGIWLHRRVAVGDTREAILHGLEQESKEAQIILVTGGLGPTADDITKPVLCEYFHTSLVMHAETLEHVEQLSLRRGVPLLERNRAQALVPASCEVLPNGRGSAPGMWFEEEGKIYVSMPGVPHEMKGIMKQSVLPRLQQRFRTAAILHRTLLTSGLGESFVAERLDAFERGLPPYIKLAYLPNYALLRLRLTAIGDDAAPLQKELTASFRQMQEILADIVVADEDILLEAWVGQLLKQKGKTLATAESCTGGYIAHLLTSVPGSSAYYKGTVVSYANEIKQRVLGVDAAVLEEQGAVSEAVVRQMLQGVLQAMESDYAIAVSGIMGPDGGTPEKPVGTVWIAAGSRESMLSRVFHLRYNREQNIIITAQHALNMLRRLLAEQKI